MEIKVDRGQTNIKLEMQNNCFWLPSYLLGVYQLLRDAPENSQDMMKSDYCCARTMQYTFCQ